MGLRNAAVSAALALYGAFMASDGSAFEELYSGLWNSQDGLRVSAAKQSLWGVFVDTITKIDATAWSVGLLLRLAGWLH